MPKLGDTYIELVGRTDKLKKDFNEARSYGDRSAKKMGSSFADNFKKALVAGGILIALKKVFDFAADAKNAARDAEEIGSKFTQVFSSIRDEAEKTARSISSEFQLAESTTKKLLGTTGDLLVGFGFTEKEALKMSEQVNRLAVDLASFSNVEGGAERASMALTKGLLGERESMKLLGISVNENTEVFKQLVKQYQETEGASLIQAKAQATLTIAYQQSGKAIGDFNRTIDSTANRERILQEQNKQLTEDIGRDTVRVWRAFLTVIMDVNEEFTESNKKLSVVGGIFKSLGTAGIVLVGVIRAIGTSLGSIIAVAAQVNKAMNPFGGNFLNFDASKKALELGQKELFDVFNTTIEGLNEIWKEGTEEIKATQAVSDGGLIKSLMGDPKQVEESLDKAFDDFTSYVEAMNQRYDTYIESVEESDTEANEKRKLEFDEYVRKMTEEYNGYIQAVRDKDQQLARERLNAVSQLGDQIQRAFDPDGSGLLSILNRALQTAIQIAQAIRTMNSGGDSFVGGLGIAGSIIGLAGGLLGLNKGGSVSNANGKINYNPHKKAATGLDRFKVPPGFYKDNYLIGVQSGETVTVTPNNYNNNFNDGNIVSAINGLKSNFEGLSRYIAGSLANQPPVIVTLPDGTVIGTSAQSGINKLNRAGHNLSEIG